MSPQGEPETAPTVLRFRELVEQVTDYAIFFLDSDGHIASWNRGAERIKGYRPAEVVGRHFSIFYPREDLWKCEHELRVAAEQGRVEDEGYRVRKDGTLFWANVVITSIRDEQGKLVGFGKVTRDLTERREAEELLRQSEEKFRLLVGSVKDYAIFLLDPKGYVATWNSGAELIKGYRADEIVGQHFSRFYSEEEVRSGKCEWELEVAARDGKFEEEGFRVRKDGSRFWGHVLITALRNDAGQIVGFAKVTRDLSERRAAELERARISELARQRLHALASLSNGLAAALGVRDIARALVHEGRIFADADICTLHVRQGESVELLAERGCSPEIAAQVRHVERHTDNPFYRIAVGEAPDAWVESVGDYRERAPELAGTATDAPRARAFACVALVAEGRTMGVLGIGYYSPRTFSEDEREFVQTVARQCGQAIARAETAIAVERLETSLATTLRSIGDGVIATNARGEVTIMNAVSEGLTGYREAEASGLPLDQVFRIVNEHTREKVTSPVEKVLETGAIVGLANHTVLLARDGREIPIDDSGAPIRGGDGSITGVVLVFRDVSERKREDARRQFLAQAAITLGKSLDYESTVTHVAQLSIPLFADWCTVDLVFDSDDAPRRVTVAHADPSKVQLARDLAERYPPPANAEGGVRAVLRSGKPLLYQTIPAELLRARTVDEEHGRMIEELGLRSAVIVPLSARGRVLGALTLVYAESGRQYDEQDLAFAEELARTCAHSIDNARSYQGELKARRDADLANRAKDEFLAVVSHELRTPLNAILGWSKLLSRPEFDETRRGQAVQTVERNAVAMSRLIEDLLDMSRVVSGKLRLNAQELVLAPIIEAAVESVRPSAASKAIELTLRLDTAADMVGDPTRLEQIVWNLLSNAVKFTPRGGQVHVSLYQQGDALEVEVKDTGRGIDSALLPSVFDPFKQGETPGTTSRSGLGLGLAITKQLVELHGGRVAVESQGIGQGATFRVSFPLLQRVQTEGPRSLPSTEPTSRRDTSQLTGLRVLVVDDDEDARHLLVSVLEQCGSVVHVAASAREALALFEADPPDVLLSDVGMPEMNGFELIRAVRQLPRERGGDVPAAAITAYARPEDRSQLLNAGFSIHLPKPIDPDEVIAVVGTLTRFLHRRDSVSALDNR